MRMQSRSEHKSSPDNYCDSFIFHCVTGAVRYRWPGNLKTNFLSQLGSFLVIALHIYYDNYAEWSQRCDGEPLRWRQVRPGRDRITLSDRMAATLPPHQYLHPWVGFGRNFNKYKLVCSNYLQQIYFQIFTRSHCLRPGWLAGGYTREEAAWWGMFDRPPPTSHRSQV